MKKKLVILIIAVCFMLSSCNPYNNASKRIDFFVCALTDIIEYDKELNTNMKYIGIEILNSELSQDDFQQILSRIEDKYSVKAIYYTAEQKNEDMKKSNTYKVLYLSINVTEVKSSHVKVSCSKAGAEFGAAGYFAAYYQYKNNEWILLKTEDEWLS